jgi:hypothetical protein
MREIKLVLSLLSLLDTLLFADWYANAPVSGTEYNPARS